MTSLNQTANTKSISNLEVINEAPAPTESSSATTHSFNNKRKPTGNTKAPPAKRKFPSKFTQSGKRTEAHFEKKADVTVSSVFSLLPVFELHTAFLGILDVSNAFYRILECRDRKMTNFFSVDDLTYTLLMCVYYRCCYVSNTAKTNIVFGLSPLKTCVEGILLPDVLAQFVESYGRLKLSNGILIVPLFRSYNIMKSMPGFVDPKTILHRMNLEPIFEDWAINPDPILRYEQASSRALKNAMELRPIQFTELEGRPEFLSCYEAKDRGTYEVTALDRIDQNQAQLGAACRYRNADYVVYKEGLLLPPVFGAPEIESKITLTTHFLKALRG